MAKNIGETEIDRELARRQKLREGGTPMAQEGLPEGEKSKPKSFGERMMDVADKVTDYAPGVSGLKQAFKRKKAKDQAEALENGY